MRLEAQKYIHDIQRAAERVERFCSGKTFAQYLADEILCSAVKRQLGIVGEAQRLILDLRAGFTRSSIPVSTAPASPALSSGAPNYSQA